ncbi:MAG: zinc dependent phospholipase C family protein [Candidatus Wallbacteria bacterium]
MKYELKRFIKKLKLQIITGVLILTPVLLLFSQNNLYAWSTYTHAAITFEALSRYPSLIPYAVYSSSIPDMTTNFISPSSKDEFYSIFHGESFKNAMSLTVKKFDNKRDKEQISNFYGYFTHIIADSVAHSDGGYPEAKKTFAVKTELNHYVAYLFMDMICYYNHFSSEIPGFMKFTPDVNFDIIEKALANYNLAEGKNSVMAKSYFTKKMAMFKASIAIEKAIFDIIIEQNPELFEQLRSYYGDYYLGVNGTGGFADALARVNEKVSISKNPEFNENKLDNFIAAQKNELIYSASEAVSELAVDSEFLRTGKLTSGKIESLVNKFFAKKSENSKAMGILLSALLLKQGMTFEEIIAYVDGSKVNMNSKEYKEFEASLKKLKKGFWYSFIPGSDSRERKDYADKYSRYVLAGELEELKKLDIPDAAIAEISAETKKRLETFRDYELSSKINIFEKARNKAKNNIQFEISNFVKNYKISRQFAVNSNNAQQIAKLDKQANEFVKTIEKKISGAKNENLISKLFNPEASSYNKAALELLKNSIAGLKDTVNKEIARPLSNNPKASRSSDKNIGAGSNYGSAAAASASLNNQAAIQSPSNSTEAYELLKAAYNDYVTTLSSFQKDYKELSAAEKMQIENKLKIYNAYKEIYEKLSIEAIKK